MSTHFETRSGAHYELTATRDCIRRIGGAYEKRRDGEWINLKAMFPTDPKVGFCVSLVLESLAAYGPDDHGTKVPDRDYTTRLTTPVVKVWETPNHADGSTT